MATGKNSKYQLEIHPLLIAQDLENPQLPDQLRSDFEIYKRLFKINPFKIDSFGFQKTVGGEHIDVEFKTLEDGLKHCCALKIIWKGNKNAFRLIYRIDDSCNPKKVSLISFDRHNEAYDSALKRERDRRRRGSKKRKPRQKRKPSY